ncbi:MAG: hypothetical protein HZA67_04790 [Rhodospirillales bacterium]|jgi:hypothetical protein|nr:hypothetical protein [Rhodospirillales bacterium]
MTDHQTPPGNQLNELRQEEMARLQAPWGREVRLIRLTYDSGFEMLRLAIKEGKRFTTLDLDPLTASKLAGFMAGWAQAAPPDTSEE